MIPKRYGTGFGCLDFILLWLVIGSFFMIVSGAGRGGNILFGYLIWLVVAGLWFAWRRGWIQQFRDSQKAAEQATRADALQRAAESRLIAPPIPTQEVAEPIDDEPLELPTYQISTPLPDKISVTQVTGLMRTLIAKAEGGLLQFSLVGTSKGVTWQVTHIPRTGDMLTTDELTELVGSYYPGATVTQLVEPKITATLYRKYHIFKPKLVRYFDRAITVDEARREDPLVVLTRALTELENGETLTFTITLFGLTIPDEKEIQRVLTVSAHEAGYRYQNAGGFSARNWQESLGAALGASVVNGIRNELLRGQRVQLYTDAETKHFLEKLTQPLAQCILSLTMDSPTKERLSALEHRYGAMSGLESTEIRIDRGYTSPLIPLIRQEDWWLKQPAGYLEDLFPKNPNDPDLVSPHVFNFTVDELSAFWHLPHSGFSKEVLGYTGVHAPIPRNLNMGQGGVRIGTNRNGPKATDVYLPPTDRTAHTTIIGKTNRGKSALLHTMVHQDIAAGRGVCVIDPKGALVSDILQHSIPPEREADVLILDVSNKVNGKFIPPPFNLFVTGLDDDQTEGAAQRLVSLLNLSERDFAEKKMAATLKMALMAVYGVERPTIHDVHCLLFDEAYRARLIPTIKSSVVANFWSKFDSKTIGAQASLTEPLEWRLERFILNNRLRAMTCHPLRLNFGKLMGSNKIILISLGDERDTIDQEERYFLGAAILSRIDYAARQKTITKPPFMVYVDEAQEFVDTSLPRMLSQLRSFGVGLVLANQYFHQLFGDTFKAIEGNVSTLMAFEIGSDDAATMLPYLQPTITKTDLLNLGKYTAAVSMLDADGKRQDAFTVETLPPPGHGTQNPEREDYLRAKCVEVWGLPGYDEVLNAIDTRYADCAGQTPEPGEGVVHTQGSGYEGFE